MVFNTHLICKPHFLSTQVQKQLVWHCSEAHKHLRVGPQTDTQTSSIHPCHPLQTLKQEIDIHTEEAANAPRVNENSV